MGLNGVRLREEPKQKAVVCMHIDITTQWTDGIMKNFAPIKLRFI